MNRRMLLAVFDLLWVLFGTYLIVYGIFLAPDSAMMIERAIDCALGALLVSIDGFMAYERLFREKDEDYER